MTCFVGSCLPRGSGSIRVCPLFPLLMKTLHSPVLSAAIPTTVQAKLKSKCSANGDAKCIMCFSVPGRKSIYRQVLGVVVKASRMVLVKNLVGCPCVLWLQASFAICSCGTAGIATSAVFRERRGDSSSRNIPTTTSSREGSGSCGHGHGSPQ